MNKHRWNNEQIHYLVYMLLVCYEAKLNFDRDYYKIVLKFTPLNFYSWVRVSIHVHTFSS